MKTSTLLKFLTLFVFVLLIGIFVAFRSGAFSNNNIELALMPSDTTGPRKADTTPLAAKDSVDSKGSKDTLKRTFLPSTKSIIIPKYHPAKRLKDDSTSAKGKKRGKVKTD